MTKKESQTSTEKKYIHGQPMIPALWLAVALTTYTYYCAFLMSEVFIIFCESKPCIRISDREFFFSPTSQIFLDSDLNKCCLLCYTLSTCYCMYCKSIQFSLFVLSTTLMSEQFIVTFTIRTSDAALWRCRVAIHPFNRTALARVPAWHGRTTSL